MKCPRCGQEMESGYLIVHSSVSRALVSTIFIGWNTKKIEHDFLGIAGSFDVEMLFGSMGFLKNANIEAYRCFNCQLVTFEYTLKGQGGVGGKEFQEEYKSKDYTAGDVEKYLR